MRKLAIVAVVVLGLLVVADLVARNIAETELAERIDAHESVQGTEVEIHGISFLLQVATSSFGEVDASLPTLPTNPGMGRVLQVDDVRLTLHDVKTSERFTRAIAERVDGTGTVPYDQLNQLPGVEIGYDDATEGLSISVPGLQLAVRVQPSLDSSGGLLFGELPGPLRRILGAGAFGFSGIPDEVAVTGIEPTASGLRVILEARDVSFAS